MTQEQQQKWIVYAALGLAAVSLIISMVVLLRPAPDPAPALTLSVIQNEDDLMRSFNEASEDAERAVNTINMWMGMMQVSGVLLALAGGFLGFIGLRSFRQIQEEFEAPIEEEKQNIRAIREQYEQERAEGEAKIAELRAEYNAQLEQLTQLIPAMEMEVNNVTKTVSLLQFAQQQMLIGNVESAVAILESVCALDQDNPIAHYFLGDVYLRMDRIADGITHLDIARQADDYDLPSADASYAYLLRLQGDQSDDPQVRENYYFESEQIFRALWHDHPTLLDITGESVYGAMAGLCRREGRDEEAILWYERCQTITPNNTYPLNNLALLRLQKPETRDAALTNFARIRTLAEQKLRFDFDDYWLWFDLLTARIALDEGYDQVKKDLQTVFELTAPLVQPLQKFFEGLDDLKVLPTGPKDINKVQVQIRQEIERRENATNDT